MGGSGAWFALEPVGRPQSAAPTSQNSRLRHTPDSHTPSWGLDPTRWRPPRNRVADARCSGLLSLAAGTWGSSSGTSRRFPGEPAENRSSPPQNLRGTREGPTPLGAQPQLGLEGVWGGPDPAWTGMSRTVAAPRWRTELSRSRCPSAASIASERGNPRLPAYITVLADEALEQACDAEAALMRGDVRGPLHGVPVSIEDVFRAQPAEPSGRRHGRGVPRGARPSRGVELTVVG